MSVRDFCFERGIQMIEVTKCPSNFGPQRGQNRDPKPYRKEDIHTDANHNVKVDFCFEQEIQMIKVKKCPPNSGPQRQKQELQTQTKKRNLCNC